MPRSVASTRACGLISWAAKMPRTGREQRVAVEQLEVAGQLLDAVDLAAPLDLHRDATGPSASRHIRSTGPIAVGNSRRTSVRPSARRRRVLGEQLLEVLLDAVLLQARVDAEVVGAVVQHLLEQDPQRVVVLAGDQSTRATPSSLMPSRDLARRRHPVQRLVGAAVGVHQHRPVVLDHDQPGRHRQVGGQPARVVDLAARNDESHEAAIYLPSDDGG